MDLYISIQSFITIVTVLADGLPVMFNNTLQNSTKAGGHSSDKSTTSNANKIKFTAIYLFSIVWLLLIAIACGFYWYLYYIYTPKQRLHKRAPLSSNRRKSQLFYSRLNQRYHKNKNRTVRKYSTSKLSLDDDSLSSNFLSDYDNDYCLSCLNNNLSNTRDCRTRTPCSVEEKPKKGCGCCGKSKKSQNSQCTLSKESADVYRSQPLINLYNQGGNSPHRVAPPPTPQNTPRVPLPTPESQHSRHSVSSQQPQPNSNSPPKPPPQAPQPGVNFQSPIYSQPQPMYHTAPPSMPPLQPTPYQPPPPPSTPSKPPINKSTTQTQKTTSMPVQTYGGSTNYTNDEQEKTVAKTGCCANKKKSNGQIHARIHGYKVDGHMRLKGKNNKKTISIPTDSYLLNG